MPEWLDDAIPLETTHHASVLVVRLLLALFFGSLVAAVYRLSHGRGKADGAALATTLVLLCVLTAMVSVVIGDSVARAFGLVGALSIVRFRTVVDDTRDTAFVIFAVIVGMGAGSGHLLVPTIGIPVVAVAAFLLEWISPERAANSSGTAMTSGTVVVRLGLGHAPEDALNPVFTRHTESCRVTEAATARQGAAIDVTYAVQLKESSSAPSLVTELNQIEGVQNVELRMEAA
ncbi:MAG: DUF4956 domain-containing protein [Planctomycetaceae bacterium]|nr:DUF4956 domain-containing protein [Planctomycetaceae bacterium]